MHAIHRASLLALALVLGAHPAHGANLTIVNTDGPGEGFNDATPASPVGGNPGTTVGAQRLYVFQHAANIWGRILPSNIQIRINAKFDPLPCAATYGVLGSAGPASMWRDFANTPLPGHWYHVALANRLADIDISAGDDIVIQFNSGLGGTTCLPMGWYYGVDGNEGSQIELLPVVLHEMGHGLGFSTPTSGSTGNYVGGYPSAFDHFLRDAATGLHWDQMTPAQRAASAVANQGLSWDGPAVTRRAASRLGGRPVLRVTAPSSIARDYDVGIATFGPLLTTTGVSGRVVLANDGVGVTSNGCEAIQNGASLRGNIALIDRGGCPFILKVKNAQNAGAIAVIVADSVPGSPPPTMTGSDPTITIPSVRVTQADGNILKSALSSGLTVTLLDGGLRQGADAGGRVLLYTPSTFSGGSSVSHWDTSAYPDLLMEPALTPAVSSDVDLAQWAFSDIGWFRDSLGNTDHAPVVTAPTSVSGTAGTAITVDVTASDPDGDAITSLTADLSGLPNGSGATFVPGPGNTRGTLTWTPTTADARSTLYSVTFTAANARSGSATTSITVSGENLVRNASFESSTTGWGSYLGATLSRVAGGHDGSYALAASGPAGTSMFGINDTPDCVSPVAAAGTRYRYNAWVRSESGTGSAFLQIREFAAGVQKGSTVRSRSVTLSPGWQMIGADYVATAPGTSLNLQIIDMPAASGETFQVDEVSIVALPGIEVPNLVTNPSFESSTSGWGTYLGSTLARVAGGHDGAYALDVTGPATRSVFGVNDAPDWVSPVAAAGTRYRFTAWVRSASGAGSTQIQVREFITGAQRGSTVRSPAVALSGTWQMMTTDYVATTAGASLNLQIIDTPAAPGEAFQVDEVSIVVVPGPSANGGSEAPGIASDEAIGDGPLHASVYPNPLASSGTLRFTMARSGPVRIEVFDVRGRSLGTLLDGASQPAGRHSVALEIRGEAGARWPAGMYYYRVTTSEGASTGRFLVLR